MDFAHNHLVSMQGLCPVCGQEFVLTFIDFVNFYSTLGRGT